MTLEHKIYTVVIASLLAGYILGYINAKVKLDNFTSISLNIITFASIYSLAQWLLL
jgi:hypothetical protein